VRNGTWAKTVLTEATGQVQVEVPRDRDGSRMAGSSPVTHLRAALDAWHYGWNTDRSLAHDGTHLSSAREQGTYLSSARRNR